MSGVERTSIPVRLQGCIFLSAIATYVAACWVPAYFDGWLGTAPGIGALLLAWLDVSLVPWLANVCLFIGLFHWLNDCVENASMWAWGAVGLAMTSWFFAWPFRGHNRLLLGYYLWQFSTLQLAVATWWVRRQAATAASIVESPGAKPTALRGHVEPFKPQACPPKAVGMAPGAGR